ncbi:LuxR family transcriptional regulator, partial [mine drainage metagenome]
WAVVFRQFELAERMLCEGLAFDRSHDLDAWTSYLLGWQARLRMHQGRLREAEAIARSVVAMSDRSLVERLPALSALARICVRTGDASAPGLLQQALAQALATQEVQHIAPVRLALVEAAWLCGDAVGMRTQIEDICALSDASHDPWECGEMLV